MRRRGRCIVGQQAAVPFAVKVLGADGVTPVAGEAVTFSASCGFGAVCGLRGRGVYCEDERSGDGFDVGDSGGCGERGLAGLGCGGTATASFTAVVQVRTADCGAAGGVCCRGGDAWVDAQVEVADNTASTAGVPVQLADDFGACGWSPGQTLANAAGMAADCR